jgi:hypothetical protein
MLVKRVSTYLKLLAVLFTQRLDGLDAFDGDIGGRFDDNVLNDDSLLNGVGFRLDVSQNVLAILISPVDGIPSVPDDFPPLVHLFVHSASELSRSVLFQILPNDPTFLEPIGENSRKLAHPRGKRAKQSGRNLSGVLFRLALQTHSLLLDIAAESLSIFDVRTAATFVDPSGNQPKETLLFSLSVTSVEIVGSILLSGKGSTLSFGKSLFGFVGSFSSFGLTEFILLCH